MTENTIKLRTQIIRNENNEVITDAEGITDVGKHYLFAAQSLVHMQLI